MSVDEDDTKVIGQCLRAAVDGPFFPDWEFSTLFGFSRDELRRIADRWPDGSDGTEQADAVSASLNLLLGYPHQRWDLWHDYIGPSPSAIARVYARWRGEETLDTSAYRVFDRLT